MSMLFLDMSLHAIFLSVGHDFELLLVYPTYQFILRLRPKVQIDESFLKNCTTWGM